ncbi:uncharacterized protein CTRU02_213062 [Colletotrichum truncatum]|uniref:Uncharacterized protein n=1 Tax=Colletotrichum truncatum TaxID=5467 RepID=A0ACC3YJN5_COLTU|nr:uncharacterized protein CTRU02_03384 [Colletotrichum truncatum]KAF6797354.1 hypothetical protein CTRU02_03384 [Colletotrichum truncatum]
MMNLGSSLMLSRRSHKRLGEDQIRSGICDLIGRPAAISKEWALRFFPSLLYRSSRSSQRNSGGIHGEFIDAIDRNSSNVTELNRGKKYIGHRGIHDQESTLKTSDAPVEKATGQDEDSKKLLAVYSVNQNNLSVVETPIKLCSNPTVERMNPALDPKDEEYQLRANFGSQEDFKGHQAYTVNVGNQRKQSRSNTSPTMTGSKPSSRVEKRGRRKDTNDQKNDGTSSSRKRNRPPQFPEHDSESNQRFACPFFLQDRAKHLNCLHFQLKRVKDVKQHIFRKHRFHCSNCYEIFPDGQELDDHRKVITCQANTWPRDEAIGSSISNQQKDQLGVRASSSLTEKDQWFSVWKIIFPHLEQPPSPYLKSEVEEGILMVRDLLARHGSLALSLSSLNHTVSFEEMSSNTMPEPRNMAANLIDDNAAGSTIGTLDLVLASLSEVTVGNSECAPSSSHISDAEVSSPQNWDLATARVEPSINQDNNVGIIDQNAPWCELLADSTVQNERSEPDYFGTVESLYQPSIQLGDINIQQHLTEAVGTQWDGYVGIDAMFTTPSQQEQGISSWEDYLVGPHDLSFADDQATERNLL